VAHASITTLATLEAAPGFVGDHRILQYLDLSAVEGDFAEGLSLDGDDDQFSNSSHLASSDTSSFHLDIICSENSASNFVD
jgi:hypothetical protein